MWLYVYRSITRAELRFDTYMQPPNLQYVILGALFLSLQYIILNNIVSHCRQDVPQTTTQEHAAVTPVGERQVKQRRKLFLDLGANCGNSYAYFQDPQNVRTAITSEFTSYLFEPQPEVFQKWLLPLQQRVGERIHVFNVAVADRNGTVSFGVDSAYPSDLCTLDKGYPHGASSLYAEVHGAAPQQVTVPSLDFATFFEGLHIGYDDHVIMKIDIEAQEFVILRQLMQRGLLCYIDELYVEWHTLPSALSTTLTRPMFEKTFEFVAQGCVSFYQEWIV